MWLCSCWKAKAAVHPRTVMDVDIHIQWVRASETFLSQLTQVELSLQLHELGPMFTSSSPSAGLFSSCFLPWLFSPHQLWKLDSVEHGLEPRGCSGTLVPTLSPSLQLRTHQLLFHSHGGGHYTKIIHQLFTVTEWNATLRAVSRIFLASSNCHWFSSRQVGLSSLWNVLWLSLNSVLWVGLFKAELRHGHHNTFG